MTFGNILLGCIVGTGLALLVSGFLLNKSNNFGDSKGELKDFSDKGMIFTLKTNRINKNTPVDGISSPAIRAKFKLNNPTKKMHRSTQSFDDQIIDDMIDNADLSNIKWHK